MLYTFTDRAISFMKMVTDRLQEINTLYELYGSMVYTLSLSYSTNNEDAEEITQDVFLKVYDKLGQFNNQSSLKTWIYRITINCCLDFLKSKNSKKKSIYKASKEISEKDAKYFDHPGVILENKELADILLKCLNELPENQKMAFLLSKEEGLGNKEIGVIMNKSVSGIESLVFRAKQNLQKIINSKWQEQRK